MDIVYTMEHMMTWIDDSVSASRHNRIYGTTWHWNIEDGKQQISFCDPNEFLQYVFDLGLRNKSLMLMTWTMDDLSYDPNVQLSGYYQIILDVVVVDRPCPDQIVALGNIVQKLIDDLPNY